METETERTALNSLPVLSFALSGLLLLSVDCSEMSEKLLWLLLCVISTRKVGSVIVNIVWRLFQFLYLRWQRLQDADERIFLFVKNAVTQIEMGSPVNMPKFQSHWWKLTEQSQSHVLSYLLSQFHLPPFLLWLQTLSIKSKYRQDYLSAFRYILCSGGCRQFDLFFRGLIFMV